MRLSLGDDGIARAAVILLGVGADPSLGLGILRACAYRSFIQTGINVVQSMGSSVVPFLLDAVGDGSIDVEIRVFGLGSR